MIDIQDLLNGHFVFALGWTFLHSLWQFAIIGVLLYFSLHFIKAAQRRYRMAVGAQALCLFVSAVTFVSYYSGITHAQQFLLNEQALLEVPRALFSVDSIIHYVNQHLNLLVIAWIIGFFIQTSRLGFDVVRCQWLRNNYVTELPAHWQLRVDNLVAKMAITQNIEIKLSRVVNSPCVIGAFKPVILLPVSLLTAMPVQQLEAILLHELAHVKRYDYLVNIILSIVNNLFFFNPIVSLISKTVTQEREKSCDEQAAKLCGSKKLYAQSISQLLELNMDSHLAMAANKSSSFTLERIKSLFGDAHKKHFCGYKIIALLVLTLCGVTVNANDITPVEVKKMQDSPQAVAPVQQIERAIASKDIERNKTEEQKPTLAPATQAQIKTVTASGSKVIPSKKPVNSLSLASVAALDYAMLQEDKKPHSKEKTKSPKQANAKPKVTPEPKINTIVPILPVEDFSRLPDVSHMQLAPSGNKVASLININVADTKGSAVQITNMASGDKKMVLFNDNTKYFFYRLQWKDNTTLLVHYFYPDRRDQWLGLGRIRFDSRETRMLIIDTETDEVRNPFKKAFLNKYKLMPLHLNRVVDTLPDDPDHILVSLPINYSLNSRSYTGVFKINIKNQRVRRIRESVDNVWSWQTDQQHKVRAGHYVHRNDGTEKIYVQRPRDGKWLNLWSHLPFSEKEVDTLGFGLDPKDLYIRAYHNGLAAIFKVDLNSENLKRELVYSDPDYDVNGHLIYSPKTKDVIGITYSKDGGYVFFDKSLSGLQEALDKSLPKTDNRIIGISDDLRRYLVFASSDTDSGTYLIGDRKKGALNTVAYRYRALAPEDMAKKERYNYKARDGLKIEAFLTMPTRKQQKNLPTLVFPHGGPISRDTDAFDYWAQYFANKGYAVIQPNFRGSSGRGLEFQNAGLKSWGKEMQDDVEDAVKQLISDGITDPDRVCIVGASYGGYAALMGVAKTPDRYKCAISVNGVSNVFSLVKDNRAYWRRYNVVDEIIGNDNKNLRAISPVNHVEKITAPVLLIHGEHDRQVDIKHSEQMFEALKNKGKVVEFIELPNEDHYLTNSENRVKTFKTMDAFLDKYLPANKTGT